MDLHVRVLVIIQSSPPHLGVIKRKAQRLDQMQMSASIGAQTNDIAGIWRYFGFDQHHMKQGHLRISSFFGRACKNCIRHTSCAVSLQASGEFVERMAGGHHIVHQQHMLTSHGCIELHRKSAAHINPSFTERQTRLRLRIPDSHAQLDLQWYADMA